MAWLRENQRAQGRAKRPNRLYPRGLISRGVLVFLVSRTHVPKANDEEMLVRPGDLIEDFSRRRRRGNKGRFKNHESSNFGSEKPGPERLIFGWRA